MKKSRINVTPLRRRATRGASTALALLVSFAAASSHAATATLVTVNTYWNKSVWITIYDLAKTTHLDYGCVPANGSRDWRSGRYLFGSFYYIRGEVMDSKDCKGTKICDTTIQATPNSGGAFEEMAKSGIKNWNTRYKIIPNRNNCYWDVIDKRNTVYP
jgi:hypothetical protein